MSGDIGKGRKSGKNNSPVQRTIMVVEDEPKLNKMICDYLSALDYKTIAAESGIAALHKFKESAPDLILMDVMLPGFDGFTVTSQIRKTSKVPILMLTAKTEESDKVLGLEIGADDYLTKPFSMKELASRVHALLRRMYEYDFGESSESESNGKLEVGDLILDPEKRLLYKDGAEIVLTSIQFEIMRKLLSSPGRVFSRMDLLQSFQDNPYDGYERTIDAHIKNLRKEVEIDSGNPQYILTVWGQGYKIAER